ncbi:hypothetical protein CBL_01750 [Carabus blaptoides fortunei]
MACNQNLISQQLLPIENIETPPKNHQSNSLISEIKQIGPKRKHFRSLVSNDKYVITPPKRSKIRRVTWRTPEKKIVRSLFQEHLANRTLPSEAVVMRIVKQEPELKSRTAAQREGLPIFANEEYCVFIHLKDNRLLSIVNVIFVGENVK